MKFPLIVASFLASALLINQSYAADFGADRHIARGLKCEVCHGADMKSPEYPDQTTCLNCHKKDQVASRTQHLDPNPHTAPHNNDCTLCHMQHEPEINYCAQCHNFEYKMKH